MSDEDWGRSTGAGERSELRAFEARIPDSRQRRVVCQLLQSLEVASVRMEQGVPGPSPKYHDFDIRVARFLQLERKPTLQCFCTTLFPELLEFKDSPGSPVVHNEEVVHI
jgi:hypothetical protein